MINITVIKDKISKKIQCSGGNLYNILLKESINITAPCGGKGTCGKCKVKITGDKNAIADKKSGLFLTKDEILQGWHLACGTEVSGDITVEIACDSSAKINTKMKENDIVYNPFVKIIKIPLTDSEFKFDIAAENKLPLILTDKRSLYAAAYNNKVYDVSVNDDFYGVAIDIGTTTIAACLIDNKGNEKAIYSSLNPQKAYGADVISRIEHSMTGEGLKQNADAIRGEINNILKYFRDTYNAVKISHIVIAGNTIMLHLLTNINPKGIAFSPFTPVFTNILHIKSADIGISCNALVTLLPSISGYVGADITAGAAAVNLDKAKKITLFIDIGTNGEIVLESGGKMVSCSAAAGPAFEGANISCGCGGVSGAIDKIYFDNNNLKYTTIGNTAVIGICGSGIVDAVAALLEKGLIDETGAIAEKDEIEIKQLADLIVKTPKNKGIKISENIVFTQNDIRQLQLAKSAIYSGIMTLADEMGIQISDIACVYLAGGFGSFLDIKNAAKIGIIPKQLGERTTAAGNTSLAGAKYALISSEFMQRIVNISKEMKYIELSCLQKFNDYFIENIMF